MHHSDTTSYILIIIGAVLIALGGGGYAYALRHVMRSYGTFRYRLHWRFMVGPHALSLAGVVLVVIGAIGIGGHH